MRKSSIQKDQCLGEISTRITGMQYMDGEVHSGENVILERDFQNQYDSQAIRVKNEDSLDVGFIPKEINFWLSPLWDDEKVFLEGYIPKEDDGPQRDRHRGSPLQIRVFLTRKGDSLFEKNPDPRTEMEAVQDVIRMIYENLQNYPTPRVILDLHERLKRFIHREASPECHLLLSIFPFLSHELQKKKEKEFHRRIQDHVHRIKLSDGIHYRNLTVFPIPAFDKSKTTYELLNQVMKSKQGKVEEVSREGQVHEILFKNESPNPVLLPEGEILVGAKQNRVVNISILVAAHSQTRIPVSCVERGRWRYSSTHFETSQFAHPNLRSKKIHSVNACRLQSGEARSDQGEVWQEVSKKLQEMNACSFTDSLTDGFYTMEEQIQDYREHVVLPENTTGVIVCDGNHIIGMDYFGKPSYFKECWDTLSNAYFIDAEFHNHASQKTPKGKAEKFIESCIEHIELCEKSIGLGNEFMTNGEKITGTGVWYSDTLCHLSIFSINPFANTE